MLILASLWSSLDKTLFLLGLAWHNFFPRSLKLPTMENDPMEKKWKRRKKEEGRCLLKWERNPSLSLYNALFALKPSSISLIPTLRQVKVYLINFRSNEIKCIMKVDVLFELLALVSRISVFDEIRENSYLQKGP